MLEVLGAILPFALGVSVSPVPVIVSVLILLSPRSRANGLAFLLGWTVGVAAVVAVLTALARYLPTDSGDGPNPVAGVLQLALGLWLLVLAWRKFRPGEPDAEAAVDPDTGLPVPELPGWMSSVASTTPARSLRGGVLFAGANPKNLAFAAGAAIAIGTAGLPVGDVVLLVAAYTVIASLTVLLPVGVHLAFPARTQQPLRALEVWLVRNNATIGVVLLLVYGVLLIGQGIGSF
ncbi:GAP family protein [Occultella glacieicola]|uniref:GAP family protein n=1 Tax=Occultella glacieicola TaxID=2518684 RepID=A0ABY2ECJ7_9MICO|nr:GAP family protein [Occultella glacieicola]TDE98892.1 GAP family protein [Occultella glacieicola]